MTQTWEQRASIFYYGLMGAIECRLPLTLELKDLVAALPFVRPSAMRPLFIETPPVHYGGQSTVIQKLREAVE